MTEERFKNTVNEKWAECYGDIDVTAVIVEIEVYQNSYADGLNRVDRWGTDNAFKLLQYKIYPCQII